MVAGASRQQRDGLIVIAAACLWDAARLADRHLAESLALSGPVLYVEPPIARRRASVLGRPLRAPQLRQAGPSIWVLGPVILPAAHRPPVARLTDALVRRAVRRAVAKLSRPVTAMVLSAPMRDLFRAVAEARRIYWVKDDYVSGSDLIGLPRRRVENAVAARTREADEVVVVSPGLSATFRDTGHEPTFIPNGVDVNRFANPAPTRVEDIELSAPIIGYVGGITDRIDLEWLSAVVALGRSVLLVGPVRRTRGIGQLQALLEAPNVQWVGERPYEEMASYLAAIDVGIVPYRIDDFNAASFPLKALEYLAAGREAVASDLPSLRWLDTQHLHLATNPASFASMVEEAIGRAGSPGLEASCRFVAQQHTWSSRAESFLQLIDDCRSQVVEHD